MGEKELSRKSQSSTTEPPPVYLANVGLSYGKEGERVEANGEVPAAVVKASPWLLTDGWVRIQKEAGNV